MGVWGAGLYSSDFAMDLCSTIGAVARLSFDGDRLVEILSETAPTAAGNPDDEQHHLLAGCRRSVRQARHHLRSRSGASPHDHRRWQ